MKMISVMVAVVALAVAAVLVLVQNGSDPVGGAPSGTTAATVAGDAVTASSADPPGTVGTGSTGSGPRVVNEPQVVPFLVETTVGSVELPQQVDPDSVPDPFREGELPPPGYRQLLTRDGIPPVYEPAFVTAERIDWREDDLVLGVEIDGDGRAYSIGYLNSREMVIDRIAGIPVLVTW